MLVITKQKKIIQNLNKYYIENDKNNFIKLFVKLHKDNTEFKKFEEIFFSFKNCYVVKIDLYPEQIIF